VVVELYSESHARKPTTRAWAIIRRADRAQRLAADREHAPTAASTGPADHACGRSGKSLPTPADRLHPTNEPLKRCPEQPTGLGPRTGLATVRTHSV
jgi:hypothetical protein